MKIKESLIVVMLFVNFCYGQKDNIKLPKGKSKVEFSNNYITALFDVFLDKKGVVYVKDSLVNYGQLGDLAFEFNIKHPFHKFNVLAVLYIDKDVPYSYVDRITKELRQSGIRYYFRTEDINNVMKGVFYPFYRPSFFYRSEVIIKGVDKIELKPYQYADYLNPDLIHSYLDNLYAKRFKKSDSILSKMIYKKIRFLKSDSIIVDNKKIPHTNLSEIYEKFKDVDICFIEYQPKLLYKYYLKNLILVKEILNMKKENKGVFFMPITGELQKVLDKEKIKL
ncbi:ExbD/TolR family protein [Tenacibaculum soleae]|uniref:hypothetical protein n=1 Tax=Tenacibaculum soleae TaxID=447689 RepID=UPI002301DDF5|nr:hypothetical protein [Tenacibaculum soleae]